MPKAKAQSPDSGPAVSGTEVKIVAGLGNPGAGYVSTRHNAGFWFADRIADAASGQFRPQARFHGELAEVQLKGSKLLLLKPSTFMNRSGQAVQALATYYKVEPDHILVAHDELDLPPGTARLKLGGGHGGHNGLRDIHRHLGANYRRLRIGIGHPGHKDAVHDYVLGRPGRQDELAIADAIDDALRSLETLCSSGWEHALKQLHTRSPQ